MKTRILHTKFWQDNYIVNLNKVEKLTFNYLITNESVNICGIYELPDRNICFDLDITQEELAAIKEKFHKDGKILFCNGWVRIVNVDKYNSYKGEKNDTARERELALAPEEIKNIDTSMNTSMDTTHNTNTNQNQKSEIKNQKKNTSTDTSMDEGQANEVADKFNDFYALYPLKKSKRKAEQLYNKLYKHHDEIMQGLRTEIEYRKWADKKNLENPKAKVFVPFWKHPSTWLNQECWKDEYTDEFKRSQEKVKRNELEQKREADDAVRKQAENVYSVFKVGFLNKKFGKDNWSMFKVMVDKDLMQEINEKFKRLHPKEYQLVFSQP